MIVCQLTLFKLFNFKFCVIIGKKYSRNNKKKVYGDECLSRTQVFEWLRRFHEGREGLNYGKRSSQPKNARTPEIIEKVRQKVVKDANCFWSTTTQ